MVDPKHHHRNPALPRAGVVTIYHDRLVERGVTQYTKKQMISDYELNLVVTLLMFSMSMDEIDQSLIERQYYSMQCIRGLKPR